MPRQTPQPLLAIAWPMPLLVVSITLVAALSAAQRSRAAEKVYASDQDDRPQAAVASDQEDLSSRPRKPLRAPPVESKPQPPPVRIRIGNETPIGSPDATELPPSPVDDEFDSSGDVAPRPQAGRQAPSPEQQPAAEEPTDDAPQTPEFDKPEAMILKGAQPGESTLAEVERDWGKPNAAITQDGIARQEFDLEPFEKATIFFKDNIVATIALDLREPFSAETVAQEMDLARFVAAPVADESGEVLGWAFPERGVLFRFADGAPGEVIKIILEPLTPEPFALRAELYLDSQVTAGLSDCQQALRLDPKHAQSLWLRARLLTSVGQAAAALESAQAAVESDPASQDYRMTLVRCLDQAGEYSAALDQARQLAARADIDQWTLAQAHMLLGDLLAGQARNYREASEHHTQAIKLAQPFLNDKRKAISRQVRQLLVEAHLAMAYDVAWGNWKGKESVVGKWLDKAATVAGSSQDDPAVKFRLASQALAALVGLQGEADPAAWGDTALASGLSMLATTDDALLRQQLEWQLGAALYDALQAHHLRGQHVEALRFGQLSLEHLQASLANDEPTPNQGYLLGRVSFRMGVIHAVHDKDHRQALVWFDKALPFVNQSLQSPTCDIGRAGETLVSMAVSYWEVGERQAALRLSEQGLQMIEQAVRDGQLDDNALHVPQSNLAFMQRAMGPGQPAQETARQGGKIRQR
ncbi:MAG: hypothetical protein AB7O62_14340 [Pirellulales bacterium]